ARKCRIFLMDTAYWSSE
ncbi:hypothetical protein Tco_0353917, partial [Tanacetum coccineum]